MSVPRNGRRSNKGNARKPARPDTESAPAPVVIEELPRPKAPPHVCLDDQVDVVIGSETKPRPAYRVAWSGGVAVDCYPPEGGKLSLDDVIAHHLQHFHDEPESPRYGQDDVIWKGHRIAAVLIALPDGRVEARIFEGRVRETRYYEPAPKWGG